MSEVVTAFDVPNEIRHRLRSGLGLIAKYDKQTQMQLLDWARAPRPTGLFFGDNSSLISETDVEGKDADQVRMAVVMMVTSFGGSEITCEDFVRAGIESGAISDVDAPGIMRFAELIVDLRPELVSKIDITKMQSAVLPNLIDFDLLLDARVRIIEGDVTYATPVVMVHLDTDSEGQVLWCQMNEEKAKEINKKLSTILSQIEVLKVWLGKSTNLAL